MRTGDKAALALAAVMTVGVCGFVFLINKSETQLSESRAKVPKPERVAFYEKLEEYQKSGSAAQQAAALENPPSELTRKLLSAREVINAYTELFAQVFNWRVEAGEKRLSPHDGKWDLASIQDSPPAPQELIDRICNTAQLGGPMCFLDFPSIAKEGPPYLGSVEDCAFLACQYAQLRLAGGDFKEALRGFLAVINLADALAEEPLEQSQRVRRQIYASMIEVIDLPALSPDLAKAIVERLARAAQKRVVHEALAGEMELTIIGFKNWREQSYSDAISRSGLYWGTRNWLWAQPVCRPWFNKDQQVTLDMMRRMAEVSEQPYYQAEPALSEIISDLNRLSRANNVAKWNAERHLREYLMQTRMESDLNAVQTRIALEQYRNEHNAYPETLEAVKEWLGGSLPMDPFTGRPFPYRRDEGAYVLDDTSWRTSKLSEMY